MADIRIGHKTCKYRNGVKCPPDDSHALQDVVGDIPVKCHIKQSHGVFVYNRIIFQ